MILSIVQKDNSFFKSIQSASAQLLQGNHDNAEILVARIRQAMSKCQEKLEYQIQQGRKVCLVLKFIRKLTGKSLKCIHKSQSLKLLEIISSYPKI